MKPFKPKRLEFVRKEVVKEHPDSIETLESGENFQRTSLATRILKKIEVYDGSNAEAVAAKLTDTEQRFLPRLLTPSLKEHQLESVRACIEVLELEVPFKRAWEIISHHFFDDLGEFAAEHSEPPPEPTSPYAKAVLNEYSESTARSALAELLRTAMSNRLSGDALKIEAKIRVGTSLSQAVDASILQSGPRELWLVQDPEYIDSVFEKAPTARKVKGLVHLWREFKSDDRESLLSTESLRPVLRQVFERESLISRVFNRSEDAAVWLRGLLRILELDEFFRHADTNERYRFWKNFADDVVNLEADLEKKRLFLDFGGFGVVEFGETGYATYVYNTPYFEKMLEMNERRNPNHRMLQNRDKAIERLTHRGSWQHKFRRRLRSLLRIRT